MEWPIVELWISSHFTIIKINQIVLLHIFIEKKLQHKGCVD